MHFRPANPVGAAEAEIHHLSMAHNTCLSNYLVHFNTLTFQIGWGNNALQYQFYNSLPDRLKDHLAVLGRPNTLWELVLGNPAPSYLVLGVTARKEVLPL